MPALAVGTGHRADLLGGAAVLGAGRNPDAWPALRHAQEPRGRREWRGGRAGLVGLPAGWAGVPGAAAGRAAAALRAGDVIAILRDL